MFLTISKPFRGILILRQLLTIFLLFSVDNSSPKNISKKSKSLGFTGMFSKVVCAKYSKTGPYILLFSTFLKYFWGWKYLRKKAEKLSIIVVKSKCHKKASKSSNTYFFRETHFFPKKTRKQVRKS